MNKYFWKFKSFKMGRNVGQGGVSAPGNRDLFPYGEKGGTHRHYVHAAMLCFPQADSSYAPSLSWRAKVLWPDWVNCRYATKPPKFMLHVMNSQVLQELWFIHSSITTMVHPMEYITTCIWMQFVLEQHIMTRNSNGQNYSKEVTLELLISLQIIGLLTN